MNEKQNHVPAVILTTRSAAAIKTVRSLRRHGFTDAVYIVTSDDCEHISGYRELPDVADVLVFRKEDVAVDIMQNIPRWNIVVYARNIVCQLMAQRGYSAIFILDDDYTSFSFRVRDHGLEYGNVPIRNLNDCIRRLNERRVKMGVKCVCFAQGGDFIGGEGGMTPAREILRKTMNGYIMSTTSPMVFRGALNEDSTAGIDEALQGNLLFTYSPYCLNQVNTQTQEGGLTEAYLGAGTYVKTMYTVMAHPSSVKCSTTGEGSFIRPHHQVVSQNAYPKVVGKKWVKREAEG